MTRLNAAARTKGYDELTQSQKATIDSLNIRDLKSKMVGSGVPGYGYWSKIQLAYYLGMLDDSFVVTQDLPVCEVDALEQWFGEFAAADDVDPFTRRAHNAVALSKILAEVERVYDMFGYQGKTTGAVMLAVLGEEFGEVCRAALEGDWKNLRTELVQVAAVCVTILHILDTEEESKDEN